MNDRTNLTADGDFGGDDAIQTTGSMAVAEVQVAQADTEPVPAPPIDCPVT